MIVYTGLTISIYTYKTDWVISVIRCLGKVRQLTVREINWLN